MTTANYQQLISSQKQDVTQTQLDYYSDKDTGDANLFAQIDNASLNPLNSIQERYLTIYTGKQEKFQAVYNDGVYGIAYIQNW